MAKKTTVATEEWSWNIQGSTGEDDDVSDDTSGVSKSLAEACKAISKQIDAGFSMNLLYEVDGQLFGELSTSDMNYEIMIEGPAAEIKKLLEEKKIKKG
jgi:hypothetical protein